MKCFLGGLGFGLIGLALWIVASAVAAIADVSEQTQPWFGQPLMEVGFAIMLLAPLTFWVIVPIVKLTRRHRE